jgi:hypothetical protein
VYAVLVSYHHFGGMLYLSFLANGFIVHATTENVEPTDKTPPDKTEEPVSQPAATVINKPAKMVVAPKIGGISRRVTVCIEPFLSDKNFWLRRV